MKSFAAVRLNGLPEHIIDLPVIAIQFMPEILPRLHFGIFSITPADSLASAYCQCKQSRLCYETMPGKRLSLLDMHLSPLDSTKRLLFCYYSPYGNRFRPQTRSEYQTTCFEQSTLHPGLTGWPFQAKFHKSGLISSWLGYEILFGLFALTSSWLALKNSFGLLAFLTFSR